MNGWYGGVIANQIAQGTGVNQRIGNRIQPLYLDYNALLSWDYTQVGNEEVKITTENVTSLNAQVIIAIVVDKQPTWSPFSPDDDTYVPNIGSIYTPIEIFDAYPNLPNEGRFDIIFQKKFPMGWLNNNNKVINGRIDLTDYQTIYNNSAKTDYPSTNAVYMYAYVPAFQYLNNNITEGYGIEVQLSTTMRYTDI